MSRNTTIFMAAVLAIAAFALMPSRALAQSYSGNWPATVTQSSNSNGIYCVTLTDNGSVGFAHSGPATVTGLAPSALSGTFQLIDGLLVVTVQEQGGTGQNAGVVFAARANDGTLGKGFFEVVYGGEEANSGALSVGAKGGCS